MMRSTEPTARARCTVWTRSNSSATAPSWAARAAAVTSASAARAVAASRTPATRSRSAASRTRGSRSVRCRTSRAKTVAAAGAPPITEANEPSTAAISIRSLSVLENTTKAPP